MRWAGRAVEKHLTTASSEDRAGGGAWGRNTGLHSPPCYQIVGLPVRIRGRKRSQHPSRVHRRAPRGPGGAPPLSQGASAPCFPAPPSLLPHHRAPRVRCLAAWGPGLPGSPGVQAVWNRNSRWGLAWPQCGAAITQMERQQASRRPWTSQAWTRAPPHVGGETEVRVLQWVGGRPSAGLRARQLLPLIAR